MSQCCAVEDFLVCIYVFLPTWTQTDTNWAAVIVSQTAAWLANTSVSYGHILALAFILNLKRMPFMSSLMLIVYQHELKRAEIVFEGSVQRGHVIRKISGGFFQNSKE